MSKEYYVIQFLHPGCEPRPDRNDFVHWNNSTHKRKFMTSKGEYLKSIKGDVYEDDIAFWGEWEPPSKMVRKENNNSPKYLFKPIYKKYLKKDKNLLGTDPFIFGRNFYYTVCQKTKKTLRNLTAGSIILFGSSKNKKFILDTVFVIGDKNRVEYNKNNYKNKLNGISQKYIDTTIKPILYNNENECVKLCGKEKLNYILDFGATYNEPYMDMFRYFPCKKANNIFERPIIEIPDITNGKQTQGIKKKVFNDIQGVKKIWRQVACKVLKSGYLGIYAEMPR